MKKYYLLRFDDITPQMAWSKFNPLKDELEKLKISSILGVVPNSKDENLNIEDFNGDFFDTIRHYKAFGDTISQHGTHHIYSTNDSGLLKINPFSEFAGLSYERQYDILKYGKNILQKEGVWQPYFMAPAHSFDINTLKALFDLDFKAITDGYGFYPYMKENIVFVPQLFSKPINFGFGISTICLHINQMSDKEIKNILEFVKNNRKYFINFEESLELVPKIIINKCLDVTARKVVGNALPLIRNIKRKL